MKILFTGNYDPDYNRTLIIKAGLKALKKDFIELPFGNNGQTWKSQVNSVIDEVDIIFIPPFAHRDVRSIRKISKKPIIFDPLVSQYMSKVYDFKKYPYYSPRAIKHYYIDKFAFKKADVVLTDTENHRDYFYKTFKIEQNKFNVLYIGVDTSLFYPLTDVPSDKFKVGFYGSFLPLQGVPQIIEAAKILKDENDIVFELLGTGWRLKEAKDLVKAYGLKNIKFRGWIEYHHLNEIINDFDICLGIFGDSLKTEIVVPNKAYHYSACKKCMITKDTRGIKEIFTDGKDVLLTNEDPEDLAEKILYLKNNPDKRTIIGENAYNLVVNSYNEQEVAKRFIKILNKL